MYSSSGESIWNLWKYAGVNKHEAIRIVMQDDGNLVAYNSNGKPVWWSQTSGAYGVGTFNIT